jgi:hypothetical protein
MATVIDFTKQGNQVQVTTTIDAVAGAIQCYIGYPVKYSFNAAGNTINVLFGTNGSYSCALADLRVAGSGTAPASVAAALTALSAVFGNYP